MADINLNPDAPWTPERAREISRLFAECTRLLNYASHPGCDALAHPVDLASVVGDVSVALPHLIQFFSQAGWIIGEHADAWEPDGMAPEATVASARAWADDARTECAPLAEIASTLHQRLHDLDRRRTPVAEPWNADRLSAVLTTALVEHLWNYYARATLHSTSAGSETYEIEVPGDENDEDAPLILVRVSDGARFQVEVDVSAWPLRPKENPDG